MNKTIRDCDAFSERLQGYLDSELDQSVRDEMEEHAKTCPECGLMLDQATRLLTMCAELDEGLSVPLPVMSAWRQAIRAEAKQKKRPLLGPFARSAGAIAAAVLVLVGGTQVMRNQGLLGDTNKPYAPTAMMRETADIGNGYDESLLDEAQNYAMPQSGMSSGAGKTMVVSDGAVSSDMISNTPTAPKGEPVILRSAERRIESANFDADFKGIKDLVSGNDGYFEVETTSGTPIEAGQKTGRLLSAVIRVPSAKLSDLLSELEAHGTTTYRQELSEDISAQYYDTQSRLASYEAQLARLNEMNASATTVEDLIAIEDKVREVIAQIDSLNGTINNWDSRASYSRVDLTLTEVSKETPVVTEEPSLNEKIAKSFWDSVDWMKAFLKDAAIVLAMVAPQLVIWVPVMVLVIIFIRIIVKKSRRK